MPVVLSRTGYSGELGYELFYSRDYADHMWTALLEAGEEHGLQPAGLGALRSVRIEKKYPLYGLDLDETTSPYEAGVGWTVHLDKGEFIGREALSRQREAGVTRSLVGIAFDGLGLPAQAGRSGHDRRPGRRQGDLGRHGLHPRPDARPGATSNRRSPTGPRST